MKKLKHRYDIGDIVRGHLNNSPDYTYLIEDIRVDMDMIPCYSCRVLETGIVTDAPIVLLDWDAFKQVG